MINDQFPFFNFQFLSKLVLKKLEDSSAWKKTTLSFHFKSFFRTLTIDLTAVAMHPLKQS